MKRQFSFLWAIFVLAIALPGCSPNISSAPAQGSALVKVECPETSVRQILEFLRSGRGKDITVASEGPYVTITAAFNQAETPPGKLAQIVQDLNDLYGATHVEVVENPHPIRQNF